MTTGRITVVILELIHALKSRLGGRDVFIRFKTSPPDLR